MKVSPRSYPLLFGAILPILCLFADPGIFKAGLEAPLFKGPLAASFYGLIVFYVIGIVAWRSGARGRGLAIGLASGAFLAFLLGLRILPLTLQGMFFLGLGLLGLAPFATGMAFYHAARRCWQESPPTKWHRLVGQALIAGVMFGAAIHLPYRAITRSAHYIALEPKSPAERTKQTLSHWILSKAAHANIYLLYDWAQQIEADTDRQRRNRAEQAFAQVTGLTFERDILPYSY